jgi:signal transduction histidine kinase
MKLFSRYSRVNLAATIGIFLLAGISFYFLLDYVLISQVDESLKIEEQEIHVFTAKHDALPEVQMVKDQQIRFVPATAPVTRHFATYQAPDAGKKAHEGYRELVFPVTLSGNRHYTAIVSKSLADTEEITRSVVLITLITILLVLLAAWLLNRLLLRNLWKPFYKTLSIMEGFDISGEKPVELPVSGIDEFEAMNQTLRMATAKARQDYLLLKEFTENASHEMQTPLAIIRSKLDLLIQDEGLTAQQSRAVQAANKGLERLARLNTSLLLLAKIGNRQFAGKAPVDLGARISEKLAQFRHLYPDEEVAVSGARHQTMVNMNPELADILLNNLLGNAFRHAVHQKNIEVLLDRDKLCVSNTGDEPLPQQERLYTRFYKPYPSSNGNGLGLSIVKAICQASGFSITYGFRDGRHCFTVALHPLSTTDFPQNQD